MKIGAYSPEIQRPSVDAVFARAKELGFAQMQYNFSTSHGEEMPEDFYPGELDAVARASQAHRIEILAINGTFNMIDPDLDRRLTYIRRFERIAQACQVLDCRIITLCTGSRSNRSMWTYHPDNATDDAWRDLIDTTRKIMPIAEAYNLFLGVETEASNVVFTIDRTRRYLDEIGSPWLKVIMDCANLFPAGTAKVENVRPTLQEAFNQLGQDIILAHGKDVCASDSVQFTAPGLGIVDYDFYFDLLKQIGYSSGLILHGIHDEQAFEPSLDFTKKKLAQAGLWE